MLDEIFTDAQVHWIEQMLDAGAKAVRGSEEDKLRGNEIADKLFKQRFSIDFWDVNYSNPK